MPSLSDAFDVPIAFKEFGLDVKFPRLDLDELAQWCDEIHAARVPEEEKLIPGNATPEVRFKLRRNIRYAKPTLGTLAEILFQPAPIKRALELSLAKAGVVDPDAQRAILAKIPPWRKEGLAQDVSGLFEPVAPPLPAAGGGEPSPLPAAGETTASDGPTSNPTTGDGSGSSSAGSSAGNTSSGG